MTQNIYRMRPQRQSAIPNIIFALLKAQTEQSEEDGQFGQPEQVPEGGQRTFQIRNPFLILEKPAKKQP